MAIPLFTRRAALFLCTHSILTAASNFWNRKPPAEWSSEELTQLLSRSPWAKEVNAEFVQDTDYTVGGAAGPRIGRGGQIEAPRDPTQFEIGGDKNSSQPAGSKRRQPVTVLWESAQPVRDATGKPLSSELDGRYVLSVSGLPFGIMEKPRRGPNADDRQRESPAEMQARMIGQLKAAATLEARGKEPEQAGVVMPAARQPGTYIFGFSKELLPLDPSDRDVLFTLRTALMSVKAKFDPKEMMYKGHLAL